MAEKKKPAAKKTTTKAPNPTASPRAARHEALEAERTRAEAKKAETAATFAEADKKADPEAEIEAARVGLQVRGY